MNPSRVINAVIAMIITCYCRRGRTAGAPACPDTAGRAVDALVGAQPLKSLGAYVESLGKWSDVIKPEKQ
jgi:hypothetical protein